MPPPDAEPDGDFDGDSDWDEIEDLAFQVLELRESGPEGERAAERLLASRPRAGVGRGTDSLRSGRQRLLADDGRRPGRPLALGPHGAGPARALCAWRPAGARRHGGGLSGPGHADGRRSCDQDRPTRAARGRPVGRAIRTRGRDHAPPGSPWHRAGARRGLHRGDALVGDGTRPRPVGCRGARRRAARGCRRARVGQRARARSKLGGGLWSDRAPGRRSHGPRPRAGRAAPRSQAAESHARRRRTGSGSRLRPGARCFE